MFTDDLETDIGKVRQFIFDLDPTKPIFPDDLMIQNFLDSELGDVKCAAAFALETIAGNRAMVLQVMQILDLKTDGKSTAQGMLEVAKRLRETAGNDWSGFEIAQMVDNSSFTYDEYVRKLLEKEGI